MNYKKLCNQIESIAKEAGNFIRDEKLKLHGEDIVTKGLNDLVTYIDKTSEQIIVNSLSSLIDGAGFIVEENSVEQIKSDFQWVVDPLDGTTNFIHGLPPYAVSIGLLHKNRPVLGVVYEITNDECYSASTNNGSFCNKKPITVSKSNNLKNSLIVTGFPVSVFNRNEEYFRLMDYIIRNSHGIRRLGSAATDLAYVAAGRIDAFYEYELKPWDVAAGAIIVTESGGRVCDFAGSNKYIFGKEIIATNQLIFKELQNIIAHYMQKSKNN